MRTVQTVQKLSGQLYLCCFETPKCACCCGATKNTGLIALFAFLYLLRLISFLWVIIGDGHMVLVEFSWET